MTGATVAVVPVAIVPLVRPLAPGIILWTAFGALVAILLIEVLQRPPGETAVPPVQPGSLPTSPGRDTHGL